MILYFFCWQLVSEKRMLSRLRLLFVSTLLITAISASSITSVRADGNLLRGFDVPATTPFGNNARPSIYWPIGVAFDGNNIWYSEPCDCTSDIFRTSTTGTLQNTLHELKQAGALAWDGSHLWVGIATLAASTCTIGVNGCAVLYEVDVSTGFVLKTVDLSPMFAPDQECAFIDGLDYDASTGPSG